MAVDFVGDLEKNLFSDDAVISLSTAVGGSDDLSELFTHIPESLCIPGLGLEDSCSEFFALPTFPSDLNCELETDLFRSSDLVNDDLWHEISDGSDSGIDCIQAKTEPQSPSSCCSDTSSDSSSLGTMLDGRSAPDPFGGMFSMDELVPGPWELVAQSVDKALDMDVKNEAMDTFDSTFTFDDNSSNIFNVLDFNSPSVSLTEPTTQVVSTSPVYCLSQNSIPVSTTVEVESVGGRSQAPGMKTIIVLPKEAVGNGGSTTTFVKDANCRVVQQIVKPQIKIQPKPISAARQQLPAANRSAEAKSPVIASRSVASSGTRSVLGIMRKDPTPSPPSPISICYGSDIAVSSELDIDVKAVKRQQRMIKNRESACKSRKRKKELLQNLESQLQDFTVENDRLKVENLCLKRKLDSLKLENERLKKSLPFGAKAVSATVLTIFLFLSFNWMIVLPSGPSNSVEFPAAASDVRRGRNLLSVSNNRVVDDVEPSSDWKPLDNNSQKLSGSSNPNTVDNLLLSPDGDQDWKSSWNGLQDILLRSLEEKGFKLGHGFKLGQAMCPTYFNSSESLRLMNELRGWVLGHEKELKREQEVKDSEEARKMRRKRYVVPHKLKAALNGPVNRWNHPSEKYEVQMFTGADRKYDSFLDAIDRRNDTFYVVSFRRDHLLLPATAHNKTMRPLMSLMMPAVGLNETMQPPVGSIAMMQIDCEVTATRLIHIDRSAVPQHLLSNATVDRKQNDRKSEKLWTRDGPN